MTFEWDDAKNRHNVHKHGYSFEDAAQVFSGVYLELEDTRYNYGERRYLVVGMLRQRVVVICYTPRVVDTYRIISMRKATKDEANAYYRQTSL